MLVIMPVKGSLDEEDENIEQMEGLDLDSQQ